MKREEWGQEECCAHKWRENGESRKCSNIKHNRLHFHVLVTSIADFAIFKNGPNYVGNCLKVYDKLLLNHSNKLQVTIYVLAILMRHNLYTVNCSILGVQFEEFWQMYTSM